jgi:hypothetical protein
MKEIESIHTVDLYSDVTQIPPHKKGSYKKGMDKE